MEEVSNDSRASSLASQNQEAVIFDRDYWADQKRRLGSEKSISNGSSHSIENSVGDTLSKQIRATRQGFYKKNKVELQKTLSPQGTGKQNLQLPMTNPHQILKEGYLQKKTDGLIFKWHNRFVVLTPQKLYSFQNQQKEKVVSCVNLKLLQAQLKITQQGIMLDFLGQCQNLLLKGSNKKQQGQWCQIIRKVLQYHNKQNKMFLKTINKPLYEHKDTLSQRQFLKSAQTGDILLFYTDNIGAKLQRFFTNSDFDHVAMVAKLKNKDLMVFESNQMHGVSIYDWKQYIQYFDLYGKVTIRKLNYIRKVEAQATLLSFMKKNIGKKYDLTLGKLITFQSDFNWQEAKQDRSYFCSELVAKAFKSVGLLDAKKSSGRYWPVDFCQKNELKMLKGSFLGPQQSIILNKHTKNQL